MSLATSTNRLISGLVLVSLPILTQELSLSGYFALYTIITLLSIVYIYYFLPETKGKSLEEVEDYFNQQAALGYGTCWGRRRDRKEKAVREEVAKQDDTTSVSSSDEEQKY